MKTQFSQWLVTQKSSKSSCGFSENFSRFSCLQGNDVLAAQVSDHHPIVHAGVLFWNVMMQGKKRGCAYNNGFGLVETDGQYLERLRQVGQVISEIASSCQLKAIALCEGPIQPNHVDALLRSLKANPSMHQFLSHQDETFYQPDIQGFVNFGLLMLTKQRYAIEAIQYEVFLEMTEKSRLANRFQVWKLSSDKTVQYLALGHFPFGGDESAVNNTQLSLSGHRYRTFVQSLLEHYADEAFTLCADFNFNPHLISKQKDRVLDQISANNSQLLVETQGQLLPQSVTVDGVLLSKRSKQAVHQKMRLDALLFYQFNLERTTSSIEEEAEVSA